MALITKIYRHGRISQTPLLQTCGYICTCPDQPSADTLRARWASRLNIGGSGPVQDTDGFPIKLF